MENSKILDQFYQIGIEHKILNNEIISQPPYELLTWEDCVNTLNKHFVEDKWMRLMPDFSFAAYDVSEYLQVQRILNHLKKINPSKASNAHMYCNMSVTGGTMGMHVDTQDVWIWQCAGITKWTIHYDNGFNHPYEGIIVQELTPGDMLYIPKGLYHSAKPLTPRFSISFALFDETNR